MEKQWRSIEEYNKGTDPYQEVQAEEKHKNAVLNVLDSSVVDAPASRRDFLKLFGFSAASAAVLSSCEKPVQKKEALHSGYHLYYSPVNTGETGL